MPNDLGNNSTNNSGKFPDKGNFSAYQNNVGKGFGELKNTANMAMNDKNPQNNKITSEPKGMDTVKKDIAKKGLEAAATAYGGQVGEAAAKAIMDSKLGNKTLNTATNLSKNPINRFTDFLDKKSNSTFEEEINPKVDAPEEYVLKNFMKKFIISMGWSGCFGCFGFFVIICVITVFFIIPIANVASIATKTTNFINDTINSLMNWITTGTYCKNETECRQIEENDFYEKIIETYDDYQKKYNISINTALITATLTYYDTTLTGLEDITIDSNGNSIFNPSSMVDFKKGQGKINELASNMISKDCPSDDNRSEQSEYCLDEDKYKKYLEDTFIRKYYFNNENTDKVNEQIPKVISEIYSRVEMANYLMGSENTSDNFIGNNATVTIMNCTGNVELEQVSLYEYLQGVLYYEGYATNRSEEFLKVMAIAAKNYLYAINGASLDNIPTTLRVRNCRQNQIYCSVENGCYNMLDSDDENNQTIASGTDSNNNYHRAPVTEVDTLDKIKNAIDYTFDDFIVENDSFVYTQYRSDCTEKGLVCDSTTNIMDQAIANNMINSGSTYEDVIYTFYQGSMKEITLSIVGYPLDLKYNYITSPFGMRVYPITCDCKSHGGTDISAPTDANIYSIADGVVTEVDNLPSKINGYGYYIEIGHGDYIDGKYEYYSLYAHQVRMPSLKVGDTVKAGQKIGSVGSTGASTGPHLHIEIYSYLNGSKSRKDPVTYFNNIELEGNIGGALFKDEDSCKSSNEKVQCINNK